MRRGTNPVLTFELPEAITISALYITFQQNRQTVLEKDLTAVTYDKENGRLLLDGGKMSKSKGDFTTVSTLEERGYDPLVYRLFCLQSHYRKGLTFSWDNLDNAIASEPMRVNVGEIFKDGVI